MGCVQYIKEILQIDTIITAGDSLLDLCMLEKANHAFAPLHGELGAMHDNLQSYILKQTQSAYMPQKKS